MAILIAVLIVALVTASNDYSKELQFRALEKTSEEGNRAMVLRDGTAQLVRFLMLGRRLAFVFTAAAECSYDDDDDDDDGSARVVGNSFVFSF